MTWRPPALRASSAALAWAMLVSCGWTPADEQVLIRFFERSRVYDTTRLADVATVVFHPRTDGVVARFEVVERGPDRPVGAGGIAREVTLRAQVRSPGGAEHERTLRVTLERRDEAWIVTRVRQE